jgi:LacI family transcriptional regulator
MSPASSRARPATIVQVAKAAGVSFKTVARVLNNQAGVSVGTRQAVLEAMTALEYVPNASARQLKSQRSFLLAFLFHDPGGHALFRQGGNYVAAAQAGALRACHEAGYNLIVDAVCSGAEMEIALRLQASRVEGVVLTPPVSGNEAMIAALAARRLRHVLIAPPVPSAAAPSVQIDDRAAAALLTRRLLDLGHRDIAFIGAAAFPAANRRYEGFLEALRQAGVQHLAELDAQGDFSSPSGEAAAHRLLQGTHCPTAIFAANDAMALGALVAAARRGVRVPEQLSIAGFDDSPSASLAWPPLTTVRQPIEEMSAAAIRLLLEPAGQTPFKELSFDFELVERGSTAPAPAGV